MINEQINKAIAEAVGWESETSGPSWYEYETKMPNYAGCLNAMHEAEKMLTGKQRIIYADQLCIIWTGRDDRAVPTWFWITEATARQRAEAFLRTLGKWEDE